MSTDEYLDRINLVSELAKQVADSIDYIDRLEATLHEANQSLEKRRKELIQSLFSLDVEESHCIELGGRTLSCAWGLGGYTFSVLPTISSVANPEALPF